MPIQHLLFISCAQTFILPAHLIITSILYMCCIVILWSLLIASVNSHTLSFWRPSKLGNFCNSAQICCSNHFCQFGYFSVSALVRSHSGLLQTFCNFGRICCFHPLHCHMSKLYIVYVTFAKDLNSGHISEKATNQYQKLNHSHLETREITLTSLRLIEFNNVLNKWFKLNKHKNDDI